MDKNTLIGAVLIAVILIFFFPEPEIPQEQALSTVPTEAIVPEQKLSETTTTPTLPGINESIVSEELVKTYGIFATAATGIEGEQVIENEK